MGSPDTSRKRRSQGSSCPGRKSGSRSRSSSPRRSSTRARNLRDRSRERIRGRKRFRQRKSTDRSSSSGSSSTDNVSRYVKELENKKKELIAEIEWREETMFNVGEKIEQLVTKVGLDVDVEDCNNNGYDIIFKKIKVLAEFLDMRENVGYLDKHVKRVEDSLRNLKQFCSSTLPAGVEEDNVEILRKCQSLRDIENRFCEFEYITSRGQIECLVCKGKVSAYGPELEDDFVGRTQSVPFRTLKKTLRRHLESQGHKEKVTEKKVQDKLLNKVLGREKKIGRVLGDVGFYLLKLGRPNTDFPILVHILARAGVDVGDINHSSEFVANWAPVCGEVVEARVVSYFQSVLPQTGRRPPAKAICDKATWKHETRMVSGLVTVVPDSPELIQAFFTGSKVCPGGTGDAQTASLAPVYDRYIIGSQVF